MNLDSNNLESELNKSLDDVVKGMKRDDRKKGRRNQRGRGSGSRGRGLTYARRSPGFARGSIPRMRHESFVRGREYVEVSRPRYRYAPRYVETRYRYAAPMYVARYPRYQRVHNRSEFRRIPEEPIHVRYEEIPRRDIRLEGTARAPRLFDRLDANRARRRQEFDRRRQEGTRMAEGKRSNKN